MRWRGGRRSRNIEDRRGQNAGGFGRGRGIPIRLPRGRGSKIGIVGILAIVGISLFLGIDPTVILQGGLQQGGVQSTSQSSPPRTTANDDLTEFVSVVLADTEDTWRVLFANADQTYQEPTLVLFSDSVQSACGFAQSAMGPFYCPGDQKVYLDLSFFNELRNRFDAPGDFAQAY
ncbi:MAG: flagellar biosynthesis protein FlgM, partial [Sneathiella sp.]|uniref:neutral zinc metallopeptidase n=1 Tax=Sneathiella sp. TaxID=1964365 RepID=UPI000C4E867F